MSGAQEIVAKALWAQGNNRIGYRPWKTVRSAYMAEAGHALNALTACGYSVDKFDRVTDNEVLADMVNAGADLYVRQDDPRACEVVS